MGGRLGSTFPAEGVEWWCGFMGRTAVSTQLGFMPTIAIADIRDDLPKIVCPTLVVTTEESGLGSVADTRAWQERIPNSRLVVLPGNAIQQFKIDALRFDDFEDRSVIADTSSLRKQFQRFAIRK